MAIVQCRIKETPDSPDCSSPNNLELFKVDTVLHPNLQSIDALLSLENREDISIPVYNAGTAEIKLSANTTQNWLTSSHTKTNCKSSP